MKRLLSSIALTVLTVVALTIPAHAALQRFVQVDISDPATTSNKNLNIAYNVVSTIETDDFKIDLYENSALKSSQEVTHTNGNSGVFSINIPATGVYNYFVRATNHGDGESTKDSKTVSVQVTNAPQPVVTTVYTNNGTSASDNSANSSDQGGTVGEDAAKIEKEKALKEAADVLAAKDNNANGIPDDQENQANKNNDSNSGSWALVVVTAVVVGGGIAYYVVRMRRSLDA